MFGNRKKDKKQSTKKRIGSKSKERIEKSSVVEVLPIDIDEQIIDRFKDYIDNYVDEQKLGQPNKYKPEYCLDVVKKMATGASILEIACDLGFSRNRLYLWAKKYPEFKLAMEIGKQLSEGWWEKQGRLNLENKNFNHVLWLMNMSNRFGWRTSANLAKVEVESKHTDEKILKIEMPDEKAAKVLKILHDAGGIEKTIGLLEEDESDQTIEVTPNTEDDEVYTDRTD